VPADLPSFRYHPDPLATGSIEESAGECEVCGETREYLYAGPLYGDREIDDAAVCPWCIADGRAATELGVEFTDAAADGLDEVSAEALDEVLRRTPGFVGWQQEHWMFHCSDAAAFLGRVGAAELADHPDALDCLRAAVVAGFGWPGETVDNYLSALHRDGAATAYLFRCLVCGTHLAYSDQE
jgi:uncharacterized protein CbrC (UPF0167 family)